jgi:hypothetical protein
MMANWNFTANGGKVKERKIKKNQQPDLLPLRQGFDRLNLAAQDRLSRNGRE